MAFSYAVALTGGIATGKSTVSEIFKSYGVAVIDADTVAHQVLDKQRDQIAELFGVEYIQGGVVDRKSLGALVFRDHEAKAKLEALVHPLIRQEIIRQSEALDRLGAVYLVDVPLFYETNRYPIERVIVVYAPRAIQLERLMKRNGWTREEAEQRIDAQMDIETKRDRATYLIDNSGDLQALQSECDKIYHKIKQ